MAIRDRLITLADQARSVVRNVPALFKAARPGERVDAPNFPPGVMAPAPNVDRYPIRIGSELTFTYISAAKRQSDYGYRLQWVDLLTELLERDPSAEANLIARINATAGGRIQVVSAAASCAKDTLGQAERARIETARVAAGLSPSLPEMTEDERILADQIAAHVQRQIDALPRKPQALAMQLWAIYYGPTANELIWDRTPGEWRLRELGYIHPRRIAYPDQNNYHAHIWDQGLVVPSGPEWRDYLTTGLFGIDTEDYQNKFLVHSPYLISGYATQDGLGRIIAWYMAAKIMGARSFMQFIERYAKPGVLATYNTSNEFDNQKPRNAIQEDIELAQQVVTSMGFGGAPGATIPDSIKLELFGPGAKGSGSDTANPKAFADWCDDQIARAIRTTDALQGLQKNGARAALAELAKGANRAAFYDAVGLGATWTRDVALPIARLNYPGLERLAPTVVIHIDDEPGPEVILERVERGVKIGLPLDADKVGPAVGLGHLMIAKGDTEARKLYPVKPEEPAAEQPIDNEVSKDEPALAAEEQAQEEV